MHVTARPSIRVLARIPEIPSSGNGVGDEYDADTCRNGTVRRLQSIRTVRAIEELLADEVFADEQREHEDWADLVDLEARVISLAVFDRSRPSRSQCCIPRC